MMLARRSPSLALVAVALALVACGGAASKEARAPEGAPGASSVGRRRSTAWMRASSSRGLKGLPR